MRDPMPARTGVRCPVLEQRRVDVRQVETGFQTRRILIDHRFAVFLAERRAAARQQVETQLPEIERVLAA